MNRYEAIVFDLGGTLIEYAGKFDSWPDLEAPGLRAAHDYLGQQGVQIPAVTRFEDAGFALLPNRWDEAKRGIRNLTVPLFLTEILEQFQLDAPEPAILQAAATRYEKAICAGAELIPHSQELLAQLKTAGYRLGLLSNTMFSGQSHMDDLRKFDLFSYFDATLFSSDTNQWKPTPAPFLQLVTELGTTPDSALFVGDDPGADVGGAKGAGLDVVHFASSDRFPPAEGVTADATIYRLMELPIVLEKLNS